MHPNTPRRLVLVAAFVSLLSACGGAGEETDADAAAADAADLVEVDAAPDVDAADETSAPDDSGTEAEADAGEDDGFRDVVDDAPEEIADVPEETDDGGPIPSGCIEGTFQPYFGNLHAHTGNSDGDGSPPEAFAYARDVAGLDIMAVTDHLEQLYLGFGIYADCQDAADDADVPGSFVALCGFEYGSGFDAAVLGSTGHNNVFFSPSMFPAVQLDFHDFYASLAGCAECVGQYNHPGSSGGEHWNHFEYFADVDERMSLFEFNSDGDPWGLFFQALDAGWHVSPDYDQDNHSANWGTANDHRAGFWLATLDRDSLRDAMLHHRSFSTEDRNATLRVLSDGACWMGSVLSGYPTLDLEVVADDEDGEGFSSIELFGPSAVSLGTHDCADAAPCTASFPMTVSADGYYVARAIQSDGDVLIAAPIWAAP